MYISIAIGAVLFVFFTYATITGFHYNVSSIGRSSVPFLAVADHYLHGFAVLAWIAGIASVLAALVAGCNSQARMLFDAGRTGLLPAWLGRTRRSVDTPVNAIVAMAVFGLGIIGVWGVVRLAGSTGGPMNPVGLYAECSTMGTIVILIVYLLTNLASSGVHVAAPPRAVLTVPARRDPGTRIDRTDRPVHRALQARPTHALRARSRSSRSGSWSFPR